MNLTIDDLVANAKKREEIHRDHKTSRPLSKDYQLIGLSGELAFSSFSGIDVNMELKPGGDKGIDFVLPNGKTVDVKTAKKALFLIHEASKPIRADIYVLAQYDENTKASKLIGWTTSEILKSSPSKDFGYGIVNHYIKASELKQMSELDVKPIQRKIGRAAIIPEPRVIFNTRH